MEFLNEDLEMALYEYGLLMPNSINEKEIYNLYSLLSEKYHSGKLNLTVTPTMECNARCFYCYEEGVRCGNMRNEDADKIVEILSKSQIKREILLTWFGGEPLMNQEWMDYFSKALKTANFSFSAFLISNGSKITDQVIQKMQEDWNIHSVQITLDGDDEEYCKRKDYIDQDETIYYSMLSKIKKLSKAGISVQIRINIDLENLESVYALVDDLQQVFYKENNVTFYPAFLTGGKRKISELKKIEIIKEILIRVKDMDKLPINSYLYKWPKTHACYYNQTSAFSIDTKGNIFKCEHQLGHDNKAIGNIYTELEENYNQREFSGRRIECQKCVFLPKCHGGCNSSYEQGETPCFIDKYLIKAYLELL